MTKEEKCIWAINTGYKYDPESGLIYNRYGKLVKTPTKSTGYIQLNIQLEGKTLKLFGHQFAWYWIHKKCVDEIDHINGVRYDNRLCNLRSVTRQQNQWNRTTAKGYYWCNLKNRYKSQIGMNKKNIYLGYFKTEEEARQAYLNAKEKFHVTLK
jgi:hypothetical protein